MNKKLNYRVTSFLMSVIMLLGVFSVPVEALGIDLMISLKESDKVIETDDIYLY